MYELSNHQRLIPITEKEALSLLRAGIRVKAAFGTGGMALIWEDGEPMPESVRHVMGLRGLLNENMEGLGI